jgi:hypothetical protein
MFKNIVRLFPALVIIAATLNTVSCNNNNGLLSQSGCGGFSAAPTVSPLMFLLPGLAQAKPAPLQPPAPGQTQTNQTLAQAD